MKTNVFILLSLWLCFTQAAFAYTCADGEELGNALECDGIIECSDSSDEEGCADERADEVSAFECSDGTLVPLENVCDLNDDCEEGTDEIDCSYDAQKEENNVAEGEADGLPLPGEKPLEELAVAMEEGEEEFSGCTPSQRGPLLSFFLLFSLVSLATLRGHQPETRAN